MTRVRRLKPPVRCLVSWVPGVHRIVATCNATQFEPFYQSPQACRLLGKCRGGRVGLLNHGGVLLRYLVHLIDGSVHFGQTGRLFLRRTRDRLHVIIHHHDVILDSTQRFTGLAYQFHAGADFVRRVAYQALNFLGCLCGTLRKLAYFLRDDCKTLSGFTGTSGLDTCVECQEIGLEGNLIDNADDI